MSDILFRYLLMARRRDHSFFRRLLLRDEQLLEAGLEQLVESAAAKVSIKSQHEKVSRKSVTVPYSRHRAIRFYDVATPNRPAAGRFEKRSESFPLKPTLSISTCTPCSGTGKVTCRRCSGRGRRRCGSCSGSGQVRTKSGRMTCGACGGSGRKSCTSCWGSGRQTCSPCAGEGQLASWEEEIYQWLIESDWKEQYPSEQSRSRLRGPFNKWLKKHDDRVADLKPQTAGAHLGFTTPEALGVAARADRDRQALEQAARRNRNRYLFHETVCRLAPVGYSVGRLAGKAHYYWLVGRGEKALEITPWGRADVMKSLGWLGFGSGGPLAYEGFVQTFQLSDFLWNLQLFGELPYFGVMGGLAASTALALAGLRRMICRKPRVQTVGILHEAGEPTPLLPCLAYLGSHTGRLTVLDRVYVTQTQRMLGKMRVARQSESLAVELADGRRVHLIEVAGAPQLSKDQLHLMLKALDGLVILKENAVAQAPGLEIRLRSLTPAKLEIAEAVIDRNPDAEIAGHREGLPLEAIRREFVGSLHAQVDWNILFAKIWRPVDRLLCLPPAPAADRKELPAGKDAAGGNLLPESTYAENS